MANGKELNEIRAALTSEKEKSKALLGALEKIKNWGIVCPEAFQIALKAITEYNKK